MDDRLCNHLSSLLEGKVQQSVINGFVDLLVHKNNAGTFVAASKALSKGLKMYLDGRDNPFATCQGHFRMRKMTLETPANLGGEASEIMVPKSKFIEEVLQYTSAHPDEREYLLSGLMKLHSAVFTQRKPSQSAIEAVRSTISDDGPDVPEDILNHFSDISHRLATLLPDSVGEREYQTLFSHPANPNKFAYSLARHKSVPRDSNDLYSLREFMSHVEIQDLWIQDPTEFGHALLTGGEASILFKGLDDLEHHGGPLGTISMIPETGGKYRTVAVPTAGLLSLNYPLSRILHKAGSRCVTQGVKSHDDTTSELSQLIDGVRMFYSVDASNFTDRFPYELQRKLLEAFVSKGLALDIDISIQDTIVASQFDFRKKSIRYSVGTPQGTYASFPLASLSNGIVAALSYERAHGLKVDPTSDLPFRVIGDDIVIYDTETAEEYINVMTILGVEISSDKSFVSRNHIEMCSKWITSGAVHLQKKIKDITSESSYITAYSYYKGNVHKDEFSYLNHVPAPYGTAEHEDGFVLDRLAELKQKVSDLSPNIQRDDFKIIIERNSDRDLYEIVESYPSDDKPFAPSAFELSILTQVSNLIKEIETEDDTTEESILQSIEDCDCLLDNLTVPRSAKAESPGISIPRKRAGSDRPSDTPLTKIIGNQRATSQTQPKGGEYEF